MFPIGSGICVEFPETRQTDTGRGKRAAGPSACPQPRLPSLRPRAIPEEVPIPSAPRRLPRMQVCSVQCVLQGGTFRACAITARHCSIPVLHSAPPRGHRLRCCRRPHGHRHGNSPASSAAGVPQPHSIPRPRSVPRPGCSPQALPPAGAPRRAPAAGHVLRIPHRDVISQNQCTQVHPKPQGSCESSRAKAKGGDGDFWARRSQAQPGKSRRHLGAAAHRDRCPCPTAPGAQTQTLPAQLPAGAQQLPATPDHRRFSTRSGTQRPSAPWRPERGAAFESATPWPRPSPDYKSHGALRRRPRGMPGAWPGARPHPWAAMAARGTSMRRAAP